MSGRELRSRPVRLAAEILQGNDEAALDHMFSERSVLVRLDQELSDEPEGRTTFLSLVNQVLRFCPNVCVAVPQDRIELVGQCQGIAEAIHGDGFPLRAVELDHRISVDATVSVGVESPGLSSWTTVNGSGWVARVASGPSRRRRLPWSPGGRNPVGPLGGAYLGAAEVFLHLIGVPSRARFHELSLWSGEVARPASLVPGPALPERPLYIDGLAVGCGGVAHGWADAVSRLPIEGHVRAVDRQALRDENLGPYLLARQPDLGRPKSEIFREVLADKIEVTTYTEEFELFKLRLDYGLSLPPLVVGGLDNVGTRHALQRLWPPTLIDMGAGRTTTQLLVHVAGGGGQCLLGALTLPPGEASYEHRVAGLTGLSPDRVVAGPTTPISEEDVAAAPPEMRRELEAAQRRGQLVCGRITERNLFGETRSDSFAPAAPFVSGFAGLKAAAETMKTLMGHPAVSGLHYQYDFRSGRSRALIMGCPSSCECRHLLEPRSA